MTTLSQQDQAAVADFLRNISIAIPQAQASMTPEQFQAELDRAAQAYFTAAATSQALQSYTTEELQNPVMLEKAGAEIDAKVEELTNLAAEAVEAGTLDVAALPSQAEPEPVYRQPPPEITIVEAPPPSEVTNMDLIESLRREGVAPYTILDEAAAEALFSPFNPLGDLYYMALPDQVADVANITTFYENELESLAGAEAPEETPNNTIYWVLGGAALLLLLIPRRRR